MSTSTTTQTEQRGFPSLPQFENNRYSSVPNRSADQASLAPITSITLATVPPTQDDDHPSDPMYTRSDTLYKRSGGPPGTVGTVEPPPQERSDDGRLHIPLGKVRKSPRRTYFDYGISATTDFHPTYDATSNNYSEKSSRNPSALYSMYSRLMPSVTCPPSPDLPSPSHAPTTTFHNHEKDVPATITTSPPTRSFFHSQPFWLVLYFCFNLGLTLYNKGVLIHFPYAYSLTAIHAFFGTIGGVFLLQAGVFTPAKLSVADNLALAAFSVLYTINIAVSNLSLEMVTIPFHQVVRAATPIFTIFLSMVLFGARSSRQKVASLVPVVAGVGLATYGDYYCTTTGLVLTVLGTLLAAVKTIYTSILQSSPSLSNPSHQSSWRRFIIPPRLKLHPLDLLTRMAPLAFVQCVILAHLTGELDRVRMWSVHEMTPWSLTVLCMNGGIAFGLNIGSFTANKMAGPLSMTVAANVKQVLSIILAVLIFDLSISLMNATGILLTLAGGAWYAAVEYGEKKARGKI